jgi:hypothetical protein
MKFLVYTFLGLLFINGEGTYGKKVPKLDFNILSFKVLSLSM